jgi:hypothetical protein
MSVPTDLQKFVGKKELGSGFCIAKIISRYIELTIDRERRSGIDRRKQSGLNVRLFIGDGNRTSIRRQKDLTTVKSSFVQDT